MSDVVANSSTGEVSGFVPQFEDGGQDADRTVIIDPFQKLDNKDDLIGVPFKVCSYVVNHDSTTDRDYGQMRLVTVENALYRMSDGGTGIFAQMPALIEKYGVPELDDPSTWLLFPNGLRVSEYPIDKDGVPTAKSGNKTDAIAKTYYLA